MNIFFHVLRIYWSLNPSDQLSSRKREVVFPTRFMQESAIELQVALLCEDSSGSERPHNRGSKKY
jgi:hypothetical protein